MSDVSSTTRSARRSRVWAHDPRKRSRVGLGVGFASMIDIVFLLLMYFLLTMDFREPERAIAVSAPPPAGAADPFGFPVEPVVVSVDVSGVHAAIEGRALAQADDGQALAERLRDLVGVSILGDENIELVVSDTVAWDRVYAVMDELIDAGFDSVRLVEGEL